MIAEDSQYQYLELGIMKASYFWLLPYHEIYTYTNGAIRQYGMLPYIASTEDIGTDAELPSGTLYLVYEE